MGSTGADGTDGRKSVARRWPWREAILAASSMALLLGVLEVSMRAAGVPVGTHWINRRTVEPSDDPDLLFRLRPGSVARAEVEYRINAQGLRGPPVATSRPAGVRRVAVVGDSITFGYWVAAEDAYPAQLASLLAAPAGATGRPVEVLNFGVPGYNLAQNLAWVERGALRFAPDLVVLGFCLNDLEQVFSYEYGLVVEREREREGVAGPLRRAWGLALDHSLLASWIDYRLVEADVRRRFAERRAARAGAPIAPARREAARAELDAAFARLGRVLGEAGVPGWIAIFLTFDFAFDRYPHRWLHELVAAVAHSHGLGVVDLLPCLGSYAPEAVRVDPIHPSPLGHRVAAHALRDALLESGSLEGASPAAGPTDCRGYRAADFPRIRGY